MDKITFEDLPSENSPINAENMNKLQDNVENAINTCSTSETIIGRWIDGKPIYRKVINVESFPNATTDYITVNITNIKSIIDIRAMAQSSTEVFPIPFVYSASHIEVVMGEISGTTLTAIRLKSMSNRSAFSGFVIVEYTKTID